MTNGSDTIIDLSHWESSVNFPKAAASGIIAVVFKATQGLWYVDPTFAARVTAARAAGLLVGAYHFLEGSDPARQMTHFLNVARTMAGVGWLALDFEPYAPSSPSVAIAAGAASILHTRTGRYPVLYTLRSMIPGPSPTLSKCPLWLAEWGTAPVLPPGFTQFRLWQYTDGVSGPSPMPVPGIGPCDRSKFAGSLDQLKIWWRNPT